MHVNKNCYNKHYLNTLNRTHTTLFYLQGFDILKCSFYLSFPILQKCHIVQDREFFLLILVLQYIMLILGNRLMSVLLIFVLFFVDCYCFAHNRECVSAGVNVSGKENFTESDASIILTFSNAYAKINLKKSNMK